MDLSLIAGRLWGMSLTDHRDALVAERGTPQVGPFAAFQAIRGRVTRDLLDEIRPASTERASDGAHSETQLQVEADR